ncbi:MAG: hypothetical protein HXX13_17455 [Bacteroidetes bacterium]|nr:hypothetical protein [Bacteroidota bacterium]
MFNSVIISIAITLVFIFLLLAVMVTAFNELAFTFSRTRAKQLEGFLHKLYFKDDKWHEIFEKVKNSPFIDVLKKSPDKFPASIPADTFATALLAEIGNNELTIEAIKKAVDANKDSGSDFYKMMRAVLSQNPTFEQLKAEVEKTFNSAMDRLSGWYKRNAKIWSFVVAFLLCALLNVDTISITKNLWGDKDKAEQLASFAVTAGKYFEKNDSSEVVMKSGADTLAYLKVDHKSIPSSNQVNKALESLNSPDSVHSQQLQRTYSILSGLDVPIGWTKANMPSGHNSFWMCLGLWLLKILGIMMTTVAVSLGAPFWFDVLNRVTPLKAAGKSNGQSGGGQPGQK